MLGSSSNETFVDRDRAEGKTSHHRRKVFVAIKHRQTAPHCISSIVKECPCALAQDRGRHTDKRWSTHPRGQDANESKTIKRRRESEHARRREACHSESHTVAAQAPAPTTTSWIGQKATNVAPWRRERRGQCPDRQTGREFSPGANGRGWLIHNDAYKDGSGVDIADIDHVGQGIRHK
jgi:hypothetical protein